VVAQASGGYISLYDVGSRLAITSLRDGFLWTCQTIGLSGTNGTYTGNKLGTSVNRSGIQWFQMQFNTNGTGLTLNGYGRVFDAVLETNAWWYYFPSLAINCPRDTVIGFSGCSATHYIGAFYTWRLANGLTLGEPRLLRAGTTNYVTSEWGDYSATTLDPTDDWTFWTVQQYATSLPPSFPSSWATVIGKIRPSP